MIFPDPREKMMKVWWRWGCPERNSSLLLCADVLAGSISLLALEEQHPLCGTSTYQRSVVLDQTVLQHTPQSIITVMQLSISCSVIEKCNVSQRCLTWDSTESIYGYNKNQTKTDQVITFSKIFYFLPYQFRWDNYYRKL